MTLEWQPPGGGSWELETPHVHGAQPLLFQERAPRAFMDGFRKAAVRYGLPIEGIEIRFVNDHCYARMRAAGEPEQAGQGRCAAAGVAAEGACSCPSGAAATGEGRTASAGRADLERRDRERWERWLRDELPAVGRGFQAEPFIEGAP